LRLPAVFVRHALAMGAQPASPIGARVRPACTAGFAQLI
jgi:hypothetical protein